MTRLILDVDTGIDDALALAYLATFDTVDVLGVIGTYGNVSVDTAVRNTSYVLERLGLRHIPVIRGSSHPSWARCFIPDAGCAQFHGTDGLGGFGPACDSSSSDTAFSDIFSDNSGSDTVFSRDYRSLISVGGYALDDVHANPAVDSFELSLTTDSASFIHVDDSSADSVSEGVQFIIDQVRAYGFDVTVVATGPLTQEGNCWDLTAETNIIQDPEAADRVFHSGADITMVGLDVTHQCLMGSDATRAWREAANADTLTSSTASQVADSLDGSAGSSNAASARTSSVAASPSASDVRVFLADMADFSIAANLRRCRGPVAGDLYRPTNESRTRNRRFPRHPRPNHRRSRRTDRLQRTPHPRSLPSRLLPFRPHLHHPNQHVVTNKTGRTLCSPRS